MTSTAQIDRILSEVNGMEEKDKILFFHKIEEMYDSSADLQDGDVSIESAFGLWKDRNITAESLREKAWARN